MMIYLSDTAVRASPGHCCMIIGSRLEGVSEIRGDPDYFRQVAQESCICLITCPLNLLNRRYLYGRRDNGLGNICGFMPRSFFVPAKPFQLKTTVNNTAPSAIHHV